MGKNFRYVCEKVRKELAQKRPIGSGSEIFGFGISGLSKKMFWLCQGGQVLRLRLS